MRGESVKKKTTEREIKYGKGVLLNFPSHWREGIEGRGINREKRENHH
jgi:hypothetical protein